MATSNEIVIASRTDHAGSEWSASEASAASGRGASREPNEPASTTAPRACADASVTFGTAAPIGPLVAPSPTWRRPPRPESERSSAEPLKKA